MKIILVMVESIDGKTTKGKNPNIHAWTSEQDAQHFRTAIENHNLIIMGRSTYDAAKNSFKHKQGKLRVILTSHPDEYKNEQIPGQLEFSNEPVNELVKRLEQQGYNEALLVGGAHTNTDFFEHNLVTDIWLTIEPKILGAGNGLLGNTELDINLQLESMEKLNDQGTLLLKYKVC